MSAVSGFSEVIRTFAEGADDKKIPKIDPETGKPVTDSSGKPIYMDLADIAKKVAGGMGTFITEISNRLPANLPSNREIGKLTDLGTAINDLASSQDGLDKLATSMGVLATNIGALSTNLKSLDTSNLAKVTLAAGEYQKRYGQYGVSGTPASTSGSSSTTSSVSETQARFSDDEMRKLAQLIGEQLTNSFKNKPFQFKFASGETMAGVIQ